MKVIGARVRVLFIVLIAVAVFPGSALADFQADQIGPHLPTITAGKSHFQHALEQAKAGDPKWEAALGGYYFIHEQYEKSVEWYRRSAKKGYSWGELGLGLNYGAGLGLEKDYKKAVFWLRKSAMQGNFIAESVLGHMYYLGQGVPKDLSLAFQWNKKSAMQGYANAEFDLGSFYAFGLGVPKDLHKAVLWFKKSAAQDDVHAELFLGEMYSGGQGVKQDYAKAVQLFRKGAVKGDATSQYNLGSCYAEGLGVEKNLVKAYQWFLLSRMFSIPGDRMKSYASVYLGKISDEMTKGQIKEAKKGALDWVKSHQIGKLK